MPVNFDKFDLSDATAITEKDLKTCNQFKTIDAVYVAHCVEMDKKSRVFKSYYSLLVTVDYESECKVFCLETYKRAQREFMKLDTIDGYIRTNLSSVDKYQIISKPVTIKT